MSSYDTKQADYATRLGAYFTQHPDPTNITVTVHPTMLLYTQQLLKRLNPTHQVTTRVDWGSRTPDSLSIIQDDDAPQQYSTSTIHTDNPDQPPEAAKVPRTPDQITAAVARVIEVGFRESIVNQHPDAQAAMELVVNALAWTISEPPLGAPTTNPLHSTLLAALQDERIPT